MLEIGAVDRGRAPAATIVDEEQVMSRKIRPEEAERLATLAGSCNAWAAEVRDDRARGRARSRMHVKLKRDRDRRAGRIRAVQRNLDMTTQSPERRGVRGTRILGCRGRRRRRQTANASRVRRARARTHGISAPGGPSPAAGQPLHRRRAGGTHGRERRNGRQDTKNPQPRATPPGPDTRPHPARRHGVRQRPARQAARPRSPP